MAINRYMQPADFQYVPYPAEFMLQANELYQKRKDDADAKLDELSGLAAALNPAPGNENWSVDVKNKYEPRIKELSEKSSNMTPNELRSSARRLISEFRNDSEVQAILNNRNTWDKQWSAILNNPQLKGAIYNNPGILDPYGKVQQNRSVYGNLDYIPPSADYLEEMDALLKAVPTRTTPVMGSSIQDVDGVKVLREYRGNKEIRDASDFERTIPELTKALLDPLSPKYNYMKAKFELENGPGSFNEANVSQYLYRLSERHHVNRNNTQRNDQIIPGQFDNKSDSTPPLTAATNFMIDEPSVEETVAEVDNSGFNDKEEVLIPKGGYSSEKEQYSLGDYSLGARPYYQIGGEQKTAGSPLQDSKMIKGAVVSEPATVYYKVAEIIPPKKKKDNYKTETKIGDIVTFSKGEDTWYKIDQARTMGEGREPNNVRPSKENGQLIYNRHDGSTVVVQPFMARRIKDENNISYIEELSHEEQLYYNGGKSFTGENYMQISTNGKAYRNRNLIPDENKLKVLLRDYQPEVVNAVLNAINNLEQGKITDPEQIKKMVEGINTTLIEGALQIEENKRQKGERSGRHN